jgi:hypothetical protein
LFGQWRLKKSCSMRQTICSDSGKNFEMLVYIGMGMKCTL